MTPPRSPILELFDPVPSGLELGVVRDLVDGDLADDDELIDLVGGRHADASVLFEARAHVPRIRPILVALAARSAGAGHVDRNVQHVAEMLHLALAAHDLALGREGGRRRRVARRLIKKSVGWFGGNHLTLRALELVRQGNPPEIMGDLVDTLRAFADGQALARELQHGHLATEAEWLEHADSHTGALFAFCCRAGAWLAGADEVTVNALGRYGRHVGRLWHIAEDVGVLRHGDGPDHLLQRALAGRPVLPVIRADEPGIAEAWAAFAADPQLAQAEAIARLVWSGKGVERARARMARESWAAQRALAPLEDTPYKAALLKLANSLAKPPRQI